VTRKPCTPAWVSTPPVNRSLAGQGHPFLWLRDGTHPLAVGPGNPASAQARQIQTGTAGARRSLPGQPERRQPIRRSGRDPGHRPYAQINPKPRKQGRSTIHILPAESVPGRSRRSGLVRRRGLPLMHVPHSVPERGRRRRRLAAGVRWGGPGGAGLGPERPAVGGGCSPGSAGEVPPERGRVGEPAGVRDGTDG
jgi:hypothetical protein